MKRSLLCLLLVIGTIGCGQTAVTTTGVSIYPDTDFQEAFRNQFHFSPKKGWQNDVNGVWYSGGKYHLTYQHHPVERKWANMHWGYATSPDLIHWTHHNPAIVPGKNSVGMAYSGTSFLDNGNTSGLKSGDDDLIFLAFTDTAAGQSLVYSQDNGKTWTPFRNNPVLPPDKKGDPPADRRDPKVFWYAPGNHWVMVIFNVATGMEFFSSKDLSEWKKESIIRDKALWECPDMFELMVEGTKVRKWVLQVASGRYYIGAFDGKTFSPETDLQSMAHGPDFYAGQTVANMPNDRTVQLAWLGMWERTPYTNTVWNHGVSIPVDLKLVKTDDGLKIARTPVPELEKLRMKSHTWKSMKLKPEENPLAEIRSSTFDLRAVIDLPSSDAKSIIFRFGGKQMIYDLETQYFEDRLMRADSGKLDIRILRDRAAIEVFGNGGIYSSHEEFAFDPSDESLSLTSDGKLKILKLELHELRSIWPDVAAQ